jgi:ATP synthase protein I
MTTQMLRKSVQGQAYRLVRLQLLGVMILSIIALIFYGAISGFSVLMGGFAYGIPCLVFVWRVFRYVGASQMTLFIAAFFIGEVLKLIVSGMLFLMIVKTLPVSLLSVLAGFIGAIVSFWIVCFWLFTRRQNTQPIGVDR